MPDLPAALQLVFETGQGAWAVPQVAAHEVVLVDAVREVPGAPAHVQGLLLLRGELVPVIDLDALDGHPPGALPSRAVLLRTAHGALALGAWRVRGLEPVVAGASGGPVALDVEGLGARLATC